MLSLKVKIAIIMISILPSVITTYQLTIRTFPMKAVGIDVLLSVLTLASLVSLGWQVQVTHPRTCMEILLQERKVLVLSKYCKHI